MTKNVILGLTLFYAINLHGQSKKEAEIIGQWVVTALKTPLPAPVTNKERMTAFEDALLKSKFTFSENKNFTLHTDLPEFNLKNVHWKMDTLNNVISIQEWKDKDKVRALLLGIKVTEDKDGKIFELLETPYLMRVKRQK